MVHKLVLKLKRNMKGGGEIIKKYHVFFEWPLKLVVVTTYATFQV